MMTCMPCFGVTYRRFKKKITVTLRQHFSSFPPLKRSPAFARWIRNAAPKQPPRYCHCWSLQRWWLWSCCCDKCTRRYAFLAHILIVLLLLLLLLLLKKYRCWRLFVITFHRRGQQEIFRCCSRQCRSRRGSNWSRGGHQPCTCYWCLHLNPGTGYLP